MAMTRSDRTKARILAAAERLFAAQGIEGTSMREISTAAGLANTSSVQYHFGSKEDLLDSLFIDRMIKMEEARRIMLARAEKDGALGDVKALMSMICLPHLNLVGADGRSTYAEFLAQYLLRYRPPLRPLPNLAGQPVPVNLFRLQELLHRALAPIPDEVIVRRLVTGVLTFLTVLINNRSFARDGEGRDGERRDSLRSALADALDQISVSMALPYAPDISSINLPH